MIRSNQDGNVYLQDSKESFRSGVRGGRGGVAPEVEYGNGGWGKRIIAKTTLKIALDKNDRLEF